MCLVSHGPSGKDGGHSYSALWHLLFFFPDSSLAWRCWVCTSVQPLGFALTARCAAETSGDESSSATLLQAVVRGRAARAQAAQLRARAARKRLVAGRRLTALLQPVWRGREVRQRLSVATTPQAIQLSSGGRARCHDPTQAIQLHLSIFGEVQ